jgi:hypothetical protein
LGRIGGDTVRDYGRRILNALMTTDVAITLNWKVKGNKKSFEALNVCSIVKGKNISLTNLLLFEFLHLYKTCKVNLSSEETLAKSVKNLIKLCYLKNVFVNGNLADLKTKSA